MKRIVFPMILLVSVFAMVMPVMAEDDPQPVEGTFTNTTFYYTNDIGRLWIVNIKFWGSWTNGAHVEVQKPSSKPYLLVKSSTATNVLIYKEADPSEYVDRGYVLKFVCTGLANETNKYSMVLVNTRKR